MIGGAVTGGGGAALGRHAADVKGLNEETRPGSSRGLMSDGIQEQVAELTDLAEASGHKAPLRHVHASPPPGASWDEGQWDAYWALYEKAMGLEDCPFTEAIHDKPGVDGRPPHRHRVYLTLTERGTLVRIGHDYARQEAVSRIVEHDTGAAFVKGAHNIRAATIARQLGRDDVADAMQAAGLLDGARARADLSPTDRAQQERTGVTKAAVAAAALAAWRQSDTGPALLHALAAQGLHLAAGDKPGVAVVLDGAGGAHSLARLLAQASKAEGSVLIPAADITARLDGVALPSVSEARQAITAHVPPPPDDGPPSPEAPTPVEDGQVPHEDASAPPSLSAPVYMDAGTSPAPVQAAPGAALDDAGPGPGEPPGPNAHPNEIARYREAVAAHEDRKAAAWARWVAQQVAGPHAPSGGGGHVGHAEITHGQHGEAAEQAYGWTRAVEEGSSEAGAATGVGPSTSADGDDHAGGGDGAAAWGHDTGNPYADGAGVEPVAHPGSAAAGRSAEPDNGNPVSPDGSAGVATEDRAAAGGAAAHARQAVARRAAEARLAQGLAGQPQEMDRMRQARQELDPTWRDARDARRRIHADQARIDAILATHPHPDPASSDPAARADAYAHAISERTRQRTAAVDAAQAQATAAFQGRSRTTRLLAFVGIATAEQRQAERLVVHAVALADASDLLPSRDDYTRARADGEAHAYAAQQTTDAWKQRPEVAAAMEQHRLNGAVHQAVAAGDQAINAAMDAGDPEAARAVIRAREHEEERRRVEQERLEQLRRGMDDHGGTRPPPPGRK